MPASEAEPSIASEGTNSFAIESLNSEREVEMAQSASEGPPETMESLKARNSELEEELNAARLDAKETLLALLQMAEGVRVITKQMQSATYNTEEEDHDDDDGESKTEELTEQLFSDSIVKETCLRGTVFGTDLLRLWDAAHHVRDYARMISEESKLSVEDVIQAQATARESLERAEKAEALVRDLEAQNVALRRQLDKTGSERRVLLKEVKSLRQHMAASRKTEMERLLQQHIAGALLLHEGHLKAMVAQQQQLKHAEEEKKDEEELELVQAEDCSETGQTGLSDDKSEESTATAADKGGEDAEDIGSDKPQSQPISADENGQHVAVPDEMVTNTAGASQDSTEQTSVAADEKLPEQDAPVSIESEAPSESKSDTQATPKPNAYGGGSLLGFGSKFHASWTRTKPEATPQKTSGSDKNNQDNGKVEVTESAAACQKRHLDAAKAAQLSKRDTTNKENKRVAVNQEDQQSSTSAEEKVNAPPKSSGAMASNSYSPVKLFPSFSRASPVPPPQVERQEQKPESSRSVGSASSTESSNSGPGVGTKVINFLFYPEKTPHYQQAQPKPAVECPLPKKHNALIQLDTSEEDLEKDSTSIDDTEPSTMATASSLALNRTRTFSGANSNANNNEHKAAPSPMRIIPGSVSWSEDAQSIESNLASPVLQQSPKTIPGTDAENVELYKDLKVFSSLAIPTDDEIDDYHYYQHHYQQESPQTTS